MKILKCNSKGFTLLELMIVVGIVGVLAAIAFPSYQRYVLEVKRKAAIAEMNDTGQLLERQYTNNNGAYPAAYSLSSHPDGYNIVVNIPTNRQSYDITATPNTAQSKDKCGTLKIDSSGLQEAKKGGTTVSDCFR